MQVVTKKVGQVFEADIRSYFTRINRQWLRKMVAHRIADPVILGLIGNGSMLERCKMVLSSTQKKVLHKVVRSHQC